MKNLRSFVELLLLGENITYNIDTGIIEKEGFAVPLISKEIQIVSGSEDSMGGTIKQFLLENFETIIDNEGLLSGHIEGDKLYLAVTRVEKNRYESALQALQKNHSFFYDLYNKEAISLPSKRQTAGTSHQNHSYLCQLASKA